MADFVWFIAGFGGDELQRCVEPPKPESREPGGTDDQSTRRRARTRNVPEARRGRVDGGTFKADLRRPNGLENKPQIIRARHHCARASHRPFSSARSCCVREPQVRPNLHPDNREPPLHQHRRKIGAKTGADPRGYMRRRRRRIEAQNTTPNAGATDAVNEIRIPKHSRPDLSGERLGVNLRRPPRWWSIVARGAAARDR